MKDMPKLFNVEVVHPDEVKASKFISNLQEMGFIGVNKVYLENYIDSDIGIALGHIKSNYKKYVCNGSWSEDKYRDVVLMIAKSRQMLIPVVFLRYGSNYDDGKYNRELTLEKRKYQKFAEKSSESVDNDKKGISKEEQELLDYIARNSGK